MRLILPTTLPSWREVIRRHAVFIACIVALFLVFGRLVVARTSAMSGVSSVLTFTPSAATKVINLLSGAARRGCDLPAAAVRFRQPSQMAEISGVLRRHGVRVQPSKLNRMIALTPAAAGNALVLTVRGRDAAECRKVAGAAAQAFADGTARWIHTQAESALQSVRRRLPQAQAERDDARELLHRYRDARRLFGLAPNSAAVTAAMSGLTGALHELQDSLDATESQVMEIERQLAPANRAILSPRRLAKYGPVARLQAQLKDETAQWVVAQQRYPDGSRPEVNRLASETGVVRAQILQALAELVADADVRPATDRGLLLQLAQVQYQSLSLEARRDALRGLVRQYLHELSDASYQQTEQARLEKNVAGTQAFCVDLASREKGLTALLSRREPLSVRIGPLTSVESGQNGRRGGIAVLCAVLLGLIASVVAIFVFEAVSGGTQAMPGVHAWRPLAASGGVVVALLAAYGGLLTTGNAALPARTTAILSDVRRPPAAPVHSDAAKENQVQPRFTPLLADLAGAGAPLKLDVATAVAGQPSGAVSPLSPGDILPLVPLPPAAPVMPQVEMHYEIGKSRPPATPPGAGSVSAPRGLQSGPKAPASGTIPAGRIEMEIPVGHHSADSAGNEPQPQKDSAPPSQPQQAQPSHPASPAPKPSAPAATAPAPAAHHGKKTEGGTAPDSVTLHF